MEAAKELIESLLKKPWAMKYRKEQRPIILTGTRVITKTVIWFYVILWLTIVFCIVEKGL